MQTIKMLEYKFICGIFNNKLHLERAWFVHFNIRLCLASIKEETNINVTLIKCHTIESDISLAEVYSE